MNVLLVHNAEAGGADTPEQQHVVTAIGAAGHTVTSVSTRDNWRAAITPGHDLVAAAGGDGTVRRVASVLVGRQVPMTILPMGTANNIASSFGLAGIETGALIAKWATASTRAVDMLVATGPWGEALLIEGLGLGLFASLMAALDARRNIELVHIDATDEKIDAVLTRLRERLADQSVLDLTMTLDGRDVSGEVLLVEALNIPFVGPNLHLAPGADASDGLMDVVIVRRSQSRELDRYLSRRLKNKTRPPSLEVVRGKHLRILWTGFAIHMDDTTWPGTKSAIPSEPAMFDLRVDPGALRVYCNLGLNRLTQLVVTQFHERASVDKKRGRPVGAQRVAVTLVLRDAHANLRVRCGSLQLIGVEPDHRRVGEQQIGTWRGMARPFGLTQHHDLEVLPVLVLRPRCL